MKNIFVKFMAVTLVALLSCGVQLEAQNVLKGLKEKAEKGNPGGRKLEVLDIPEVEGVDMPKPHDFLSAEQRDGSKLQAEDIYTETWEWLKKIGCASKVSPQLLERYAMCSARWIQWKYITPKWYRLQWEALRV